MLAGDAGLGFGRASHVTQNKVFARATTAAPGAASASARALLSVAWEARPKPRPASPANVSKRGLSARLYAPNQTLIMVNTRLPKGILTAGNGIGRTPIRALCRSRGAAPGWAWAWATTIEHGVTFSRHDLPEACVSLSLQKRGSRECRMRAAPAVSCANCAKESAHEHTGQRRQSDIPCAMALRLMA